MPTEHVSSMLSAAHDASAKLMKPLISTKLKDRPWNHFEISMSPSRALLHVRSGIHLYSFAQVPSYQQHNKFVTHGYRSYLSAKQCLKSVVILSNELVNIWTHGGMAVVFLFLLFYDQTFLLPSMKTTISDHFVFLSFSLSVQVCMICSAGYHTFNCHVHKRVATRWYAIDVYGIIVSMLGCYGIGLYYGFYCQSGIRTFYSITVLLMMALSGVLMTNPSYLSEKWRDYRTAHLCSLCLFAFFPTLHWSLVIPAVERKAYLPGVLKFYVILGVAMTFYLSKFPERFYPGKFNFIGQSHNWWHVLISFAMLYWRTFAIEVLRFRVSSPTCAAAVS